MTLVARDAPRPTPRASRSWCWAAVFAALAFACSGRSAAIGPSQVSGAGGAGDNGASGSSTSGTGAGQGGSGAVTQAGAGGLMAPPVELGGAGFSGASGDAGTCNIDALWNAIRSQVIGECHEASPMLGPGEQPSKRRGVVVIDSDGRVVDNTGLSGDAKQRWLAGLAGQRWPCLAGQTIGYQCSVAG